MLRQTNGEKFSFPGFLRCVWFPDYAFSSPIYIFVQQLFIFSSFRSAGIGGNLFIQLKLVLSTVQLFRLNILKILCTKCLPIFTAGLERYLNLLTSFSMKSWDYITRYIFFPWLVQLEIFLTELSLDMLLFVLGKLEFAGPFSVKTSAILSNCCKVIVSLISVQCLYNFHTFLPDIHLFYRGIMKSSSFSDRKPLWP